MTHLLGITAVARSGKDTFAALLKRQLTNQGHRVHIVAFADALKEDLDSVLRAKYGISAWTQNSAEKSIIRPDLVAHGKGMRAQSNGTYWIERIEPRVKQWLSEGAYVIIPDSRYENEAAWIHTLGGKVVHIERRLADDSILGPANDEEAHHAPLAAALADVSVTWDTLPLDKLSQIVEDTWNRLA